ncbi:Uncharacterized protein conserved in bacteria (DUF2076) [Chromobacterium violaceum]|uniref:Uncharacterized protein conserved in bacteria (DUF2076) n=1 Tax=Chromobacterium violaceum TaxID=536 RepID=A0A447T853_CHRVL|nr:Uncharacterized protein conserved in bacteria (DUF2076) [Chromobacterium violaceum]
MTPQETQALQNFLNQLVQVRGMAKDPQANAAIMQAAAQQPDAVYLLVLRCMQQDQALNAANAQIAKLQSDLQAARSAPVPPRRRAGTFLDPTPVPLPGRRARGAAFAAPRQAAPAPAYQQPRPPTKRRLRLIRRQRPPINKPRRPTNSLHRRRARASSAAAAPAVSPAAWAASSAMSPPRPPASPPAPSWSKA